MGSYKPLLKDLLNSLFGAVFSSDSKHKSKFVSGKVIKQKRGHYKNLRKQLQQVRTPSSKKRLKGIRHTTEKVRVKDRYVSVSWSFYDLEQKLIYKALRNQSKVIKVNPAYTSQMMTESVQ